MAELRELPPVSVSPWSSRRSLLFDLALAAVGLLVVVAMQLGGTDTDQVVLSFLEIAPLVLRRTRPSTSFALVAGFMALQVFVVDAPIWGQVAMPIAVYSMAAHAPRRNARVALAVALLAGIVGPASWLRAYAAGNTLDSLLGLFVVTEVIVVAAWALGSLTRTRQAYVAQLVERGHRLEVEAAQRADLAASDERARIAREMHDVIAHGLSVIIVQADGAGYAVHKDPASASRALATISATGRESLTEMRRMLGLLRSDDGGGSRPQPGVEDLGYLLEQSRGAGMDLAAHIADPLPPLDPGTGLTVYRIVQEGLTNARKHAGPGVAVQVRVDVTDAGLLLVGVCDDGRGPSGEPSAGHGLVGMRERVGVHGGRLRAGARPGGGFAVEAEIPLVGTPTKEEAR